MLTANTVNTSVALNQPHWVPGHIVINDVAGLLQVNALGEYIRADYNICLVSITRFTRCFWCEACRGTLRTRNSG